MKERSRIAKTEMIDAYGGRCSCCGDAHFEFLSIDHINGGGVKHRSGNSQLRRGGRDFYNYLKRMGWPKDEYRLLCMNCNSALGHYGYCPHQILTTMPILVSKEVA